MMRLTAAWSRFFGGLMLLVTLLATATVAPAATAQTGESSVEVHNRSCPTEYAGDDFFEDCHDTAPDPGLTFTFTNGITEEGETDAEGDIGFANLPEGSYTITGGVPGEFAESVVYCAVGTAETSNQQPVEFEYVTGGIEFFLPADTNVICDWYEIPFDLQGEPTATQGLEPNGSSIEIHNRICPTEYAGDDFFEDCHDTAPDPGLTFTFANGVTRDGTTNAEGDVGFANLPAGTYTITGGVPGEFAERLVYCAVGTEEVRIDQLINFDYVTGGIQVDLPSNTNVICDWYQIPYDLRGEPTATATPVTPTPSPTSEPLPPGRPLQIHEGSCDPDALGEIVVELQDLRSPTDDGDVMGQATAVVAETSATTVPLTLDELFAADHAVVAFSEDDTDANAEPVACTEIGGTLNDNGELVIGLREQDDSGFTGIAYVTASGDDPSATDISVFLAEGLSEDNVDATPEP